MNNTVVAMAQLVLSVLGLQSPTPTTLSKDSAAVQAAVQVVADQEFEASAKAGRSAKREIRFVSQPGRLNETQLKTLRSYVVNRGWPIDSVERVRAAEKKTEAFDAFHLDGVVISDRAQAEVQATSPGHTADGNAVLFVNFRLNARHLWMVRLAWVDGRWSVLEAAMIAAS